MRNQTPSFVVQTKLHLQDNVQRHLNKSFNIANSVYNETLGFGLKRFSAMKKNPRYQELLELRRVSRSQEIDNELKQIQMDYGLTKYQLSTWVLARRKQNKAYQHLNSAEIQVIAENAYQTLSQVLFYKTKNVRFRTRYDRTHSFRNRTNTTGTRLVVSEKPYIAYRLYLHKKSTFVDIPRCAFTPYQQTQLARADKIKYVQIISKTIRGEKVYYLQIVCQGIPVSKIQKGESVTGIDPGISTVAYVSKNTCELVDLVPKNFVRKERLIKNLSRKLEQSRQVNNPEAYNENGTRKKNACLKPLSKRAKRLVIRKRKAYRSLCEDRRKLQGELINCIVSLSAVIKIEELKTKNLQKRTRETRINPKTGRPFSKKRYGKAIFKAAPSRFRTLLVQRANSVGCEVEVILPTKTKPSQYNHITGEFNKKELKTRIYSLTEEISDIQRDLYSAFLIAHIKDDEYRNDELVEDFNEFYTNMKEHLEKLRQTPTRLSWYVK